MEFERTKYSVYARADENNKVIKVFSTCFEQPKDTDILLKTGSGDEFVLVQGQYQLFNDDRTHKYCIDNGVMRECTKEELAVEKADFPELPKSAEERLKDLEENDIYKTECIAEILYENSLMRLGLM